MSSDQLLARPAVTTDAQSPLLDAAWENRSAGELRKIVEHGLAGGESFEGAARELERRARNVTRQAEETSEADRIHQQALVRYLLGGLALVAVAGLIFGLFFV